jgi:hypothetical protein
MASAGSQQPWLTAACNDCVGAQQQCTNGSMTRLAHTVAGRSTRTNVKLVQHTCTYVSMRTYLLVSHAATHELDETHTPLAATAAVHFDPQQPAHVQASDGKHATYMLEALYERSKLRDGWRNTHQSVSASMPCTSSPSFAAAKMSCSLE